MPSKQAGPVSGTAQGLSGSQWIQNGGRQRSRRPAVVSKMAPAGITGRTVRQREAPLSIGRSSKWRAASDGDVCRKWRRAGTAAIEAAPER